LYHFQISKTAKQQNSTSAHQHISTSAAIKTHSKFLFSVIGILFFFFTFVVSFNQTKSSLKNGFLNFFLNPTKILAKFLGFNFLRNCRDKKTSPRYF